MCLRTVKIVTLLEGGEIVNNAILMESGADNIDFMIHGNGTIVKPSSEGRTLLIHAHSVIFQTGRIGHG